MKYQLERILDKVEDPTYLPLALLKDITKDFSEERKIGQGGFGEVYKGVLGGRIIAVKRIHINVHTFDNNLFTREVTSLIKINHRNVVRFLGLCSEGYQKPIEKDGSGEFVWANVLERLLCFEYISNGSLDKHITDELRGFEWETRYEIITGICEGLRYLHKEKNIIHMDLKPENILLDHQDKKYMVPKITDFGLSRSNKKSHTVGQRYGTFEYLAPEYRENSKTTTACDIYSLGLIIIELVTGCKDIPDKNNVLRRWRHRWNKPPTQLQYQQLTRCMYIAECCRELKPEARPHISKIISHLSESKSTYGPIIPCLDEDDMLRINPLELVLPYELKTELSCSVELNNDTCKCIAFTIQLPTSRYIAQPDKGIVRPESKCSVKITVQARDVGDGDHADKLIVQSMHVEDSGGLRNEDIREDMFEKMGRIVDVVDLMVVYESRKPHENFERTEVANTPAEEIPELKNCESSSGSSGKAEAASTVNLAAEKSKIAFARVDAGWPEGIENDNVHQGRGMVTRDIRHYSRLISNQLNLEVVTGAMSTLLPMLSDLLTEEYNLQKKTRGEIKFLKSELESMESALIKVSEAPLDQPPDIQVKLWARGVRDMSYEIEDNIDEFLACLECRKQKKSHSFMGFINRSMDMLTEGNIRHKIGVDTNDTKSRTNEIESRDKFKVDSAAPKRIGTSIDTPRQLAFFQKSSELIGTEEKSLDIVRMLTEGDGGKRLKKVSIFGFGGLGKTTLANLVYQKLRLDFDYGAFVSVSLNPNIVKLFKTLLYHFDDQQKNTKHELYYSEIQLINLVRGFLRNKRYLIVIDGIQDKSLWKKINCFFIENECGSRVIATTRSLDVAKEVGVVYQLQHLSTSDSRRLFNRRVFGTEDKYLPTKLAEVSENILRKCGGVPLAIITLASVLAGEKGQENTYMYWSNVYQSIGSGLENNPDLKDMRRILYVSYYALPPNLKACLLYLSLYPEDYCIETKRLVWKWIGEGFVHEEQGKSLYEVGEAYFDELINKGLIEPIEINIQNKVRSCRVHNMVFDLIALLSNEENFLTTLGGQQPKSVPSKVRRLSVQTSEEEEDVKQMPTNRLSSVRSVTVFSTSLSFLTALSIFHVLRTLDLSGCAKMGNLHMKDICNLLNLRFLCIKGTSITDIPKEIGNLHLLQVLDIRSCRSLKKLPSTFVQLRQLMFIDMGDCLVSTLLLRSMSSFPSLSSLTIGLKKLTEEDLRVLGGMPSLRDLSIDVVTPRRRGENRLVIDNGCPFRCLTRLHIEEEDIDFVFREGTMQMLQILWLEINVGDYYFGLENLTSLEHVYVEAHGKGDVEKQAMSNALSNMLDLNPNKPRLTVKFYVPPTSYPTKHLQRIQRARAPELSIE